LRGEGAVGVGPVGLLGSDNRVPGFDNELAVPVLDLAQQRGLGGRDTCALGGREQLHPVLGDGQALAGRPRRRDVGAERLAASREQVNVSLAHRDDCPDVVASAASYAVLNLVIYGYLRYSYGFSPFSM
jgi:hypothetical protein